MFQKEKLVRFVNNSFSTKNKFNCNLTDPKTLTSLNTNILDTNVIWWYYFSYDTKTISNLTFTLKNSKYATAEVYIEKANSTFAYQGDLITTMTVSYSNSSDKYIWILVNPTDT